MKILWHSVAPWVGSGYGNQTKEFASRIRDLGHDVAISAYWGITGHILQWEGMDIYPGDGGDFGSKLLPTYATMHQADLVITLMDVWPLKAESLKHVRNLASWVPVDHDPVPASTVAFFDVTGARPIAMSLFGERALEAAGLDPLYVPHGVDTKVLRPMREKRNELRASLGVERDGFLVGMVAANKGRNPARKSFPEVFQAFGEFKKHHPKAHLHLHADPTNSDQGVPMERLRQQCGIPEDSLTFSHPINVEIGLTPQEMATMYSAFDVLANPSYGEGFGIPIVEAQACGCPVIVTDFSAMTELCGAGWLVEGDPWYDAQHGSFFARPRVRGAASIVEALEKAYKARHDKALRHRAREFAISYDSDLVASKYWPVAIEHLTPRVKTPGGIVLPEGVKA